MALREAWLRGKQGSLAPCEQAKLWALREVLRKQDEATDQYQWMSEQVRVVGNGRTTGGGNPGRAAVKKFFDRVDEVGTAWYPGAQQKVSSGRPVGREERRADNRKEQKQTPAMR